VETAGGKLISLYGTVRNGPGVLAILDVPDSTMGPAIAGVAQLSGAFPVHAPRDYGGGDYVPAKCGEDRGRL
jgi:hypothetical protein